MKPIFIALLLALTLSGCGGGSGNSGNVCDVSDQLNSTVQVTPFSVDLAVGNPQQFSVSAKTCQVDANPALLTWSIDEAGGGTIAASPTGANSRIYTAPQIPGTYHIRVTYNFSGIKNKSNAATVRVH